MSLHKLTAGSGYDYLTRQVAALDATEKGHTGLASYYTELGETPGRWIGSGMAGIDGLVAGDVVTAEQMQALFGSGHHPLAQQRADQLTGTSVTGADIQAATRLGQPYKVYDGDVSAFRIEVAKRLAGLNQAAGVPADWPVPAEARARVRTEVAREFFRADHGREPDGARELAATIAKHSRPRTQAVAGYDLCFSPVKSVSALWAVADPRTSAQVELAHQAAVQDALTFLERHALFTRTGTNGIRQVDAQGLVATSFTHRDSRAGDPDLHTHVAVANKVQTLNGRWLSIDGRVLYKAAVTASETYNTALERHLQDRLGVRFLEREDTGPRKRPVREIVGIDPALNERWSARRASIESRRSELTAAFQATHGRPPNPVESLQLAQQATLETREAKHEPRTLAEQRASWRAQAVEVLGDGGRVDQMVRDVLSPTAAAGEVVDAAWVARTADHVLDAMQERRATWQMWHVRAEAQRQVRATQVPTGQVDQLVDQLVDEVLTGRCVSLARTGDGLAEPELLRRGDGASVYTVAGADLYTSTAVLDAEQRLVETAGRRDGHAVEHSCVDLALLEAAANGVTLNAGQAALVRQMATSGARLQLGIAPAGSGKTTAMRALAGAWVEGGGTVIGLAPSAAAAAALREQIDTRTDTLAKLTWSLASGDTPAWVEQIGPSTLVLVDEAGMADTMSLDSVVQYVIARGGSVRLIGDDQQLAAIGAGGVLRDIQANHGAAHLTELLRFADPAEGAATLALREGRTEALGFYLDRSRVHVGDLSTMTDDVFAAWQADRGNGLDAIMLAPTRDLVSELNQRARSHRLAGAKDPGRVVRLSDGNHASVGELVITRTNNRQLRTTSTDWVKNGDRWTVLAIGDHGDVTVQHSRNGRTVRLPSDYVQTSTELGYACTTHTAQGVSVDTMHGLASGQESRQQLYTMLTRGRHANHVYLEVVGDGDPHSVIRPETIHPLTPTELLEQILVRDEASQSASTLLRQQSDPAALLGQAAPRYLDALYVAAEDIAGAEAVAGLDVDADQVLPGLSAQPAWPALRAHLLLLGAHGADPVTKLRAAAGVRELGSAADTAAVLDWRLDETGLRNAGPGPLPWMPAIPDALRRHRQWGPYLNERARLVEDLARQVKDRTMTADQRPEWAQQLAGHPDADAVADVEVWRAAVQVPTTDRRPTGAAQLQKAPATWQRTLNGRLSSNRTPAFHEWSYLLERVAPGVRGDDYTPLLAERLAAISRAGVNPHALLQAAAAEGSLPDDHAAAALWWRMSRHISPAVAAQVDRDHTLTTDWTPRLAQALGTERAAAVQSSPFWPALVTTIDHGLHRGWTIQDLLHAVSSPSDDDVDQCQAMVWRASILTDPAPPEDVAEPWHDAPPEDMWEGVEPPAEAATGPNAEQPQANWSAPSTQDLANADHVDEPVDAQAGEDVDDLDVTDNVEHELWLQAWTRDSYGPAEPTDADIERLLQREIAWHETNSTRERLLQVNQLTLAYYQDQYPGSWGRQHLTERLGHDLLGDNRFSPGHAPAGWTNLVDHLRRQGVSDAEMLEAGVATTASTGRLIDRFRDRVVLPIVHNDDVLGFVARRHPDLTDDDKAGPKYLNTADTVLFSKGAQLYVAGQDQLRGGAIPVRVEGPIDAWAVTIATGGSHVGVAPLGTSLTDEQAAQLARLGRDPVVATDADIAGRVAAERDYWILAPHRLDPTYALFPAGSDPADLLTRRGPEALAQALHAAADRPLGDVLIEERLTNLPAEHAGVDAAHVAAARPPATWDAAAAWIAGSRNLPLDQVRGALLTSARAWNRNPRGAAQTPLRNLSAVRARLVAAESRPPAERWRHLAHELDPRLLEQGDWPALAELIHQAHQDGHDVAGTAHQIVCEQPLGELPAQDLRYRLVSRLDTGPGPHVDTRSPADEPGTRVRGAFGAREEERRAVKPQAEQQQAPRR